MGGQANQQPVFYDAELGQYYTQTPQNQSPFAGVFNNNQLSAMSGGMGQQNSWLSSIFGSGGERTYLNNLNRQSAIKELAPYKYADISLDSIFPALNQGSSNSALSGLLSGTTPSATGSASSGAGRFL